MHATKFVDAKKAKAAAACDKFGQSLIIFDLYEFVREPRGECVFARKPFSVAGGAVVNRFFVLVRGIVLADRC